MTTTAGPVVLRLTDHSWVNVVHGAVLGGLFLLTIIVMLLVVLLAWPGDLTDEGIAESSRLLAWSSVAVVVAGWAAVLTGTFVVDVWFHTGPSSAAALLDGSRTYRAWGVDLIRVKEIVSWGAAVLATAGAVLAYQSRFRLAGARRGRRGWMIALLTAALTAAGLGGALGVLLTKLAPLM